MLTDISKVLTASIIRAQDEMVWTCSVNYDRIPNRVWNIKSEERCPKRRLRPKLEQHIRNAVTQMDRRAWKQTEEAEEFWEDRETHENDWLLDDLHKVKMSYEQEQKIRINLQSNYFVCNENDTNTDIT